jgi:tetratricopeptide (TPR) repeat protein
MIEKFSVAIFVCLGWILSVCLHEFGHAVVAYWGGDTSVKDKGYLTLNPLKYTDFSLSLLLPILFLLMGGIALPGAAVYIDERRLRNQWWKSAVSAAGPLASVIVALVLAFIFQFNFAHLDSDFSQLLPDTEYPWIGSALACLIFLEIYVIILNSLPIPPLDGYGVIEPWLPQNIQIRLRKFSRVGIFFLFMLLWIVEPLNRFLSELSFSIARVLGISSRAIAEGFENFQGASGLLLITALAVGLLIRRLLRKPHEVWHDRGKVQMNLGKYEKAIAAFDKAIEIKPDYFLAWCEKGLAQEKLQQYEGALNSIEAAIQLKPDDYAIWNLQGKLLCQLQRYEEALDSYEKALKLNSDYFNWYCKGWTLEKLHRYKEALIAYEKAIQLQPDNSDILISQGNLLHNIQRYKEAIASYEKAIAIDSNNYELWRNRGVTLEKLQNYEEAFNSYDKALLFQPENPQIWSDRSRALYHLQRYEEVINSLDRAIQLQSDNPIFWYSKACCYALQGNVSLAIENLQKAIELNPSEYKKSAMIDPDFDAIRENELFKRLISL